MALKYDWSQLASLPNFMSESIAKGQIVAAVRAAIPALQDASIDTLYNAAIAEMLNGGIAMPINVTLPPSRTTPDLSTYLANNAEYNVQDFAALVTPAGTGTGDDTAAIQAAAAARTGGVGSVVLKAGKTYRVNQNVTFTFPLKFEAGAKLLVGAGMQVILQGALVGPPTETIFTFEAGGKVDFTGNAFIHHFDPRWWGVKGDAQGSIGNGSAFTGTNDQPALTSMWGMLPYGAIVRFPGSMLMALDTTFSMASKTGVRLECGRDPRQGSNGHFAAFVWRGADGGTMVQMDSSTFCYLDGFDLSRHNGATNVIGDGHGAAVPVALDYTYFNGSEYTSLPGGFIGSNCVVRRCNFVNYGNRSDYVAIDVTRLALQNQENHEFIENTIRGLGKPFLNVTVSATAGAAAVTATVGALDGTVKIGARVRIPGAGAAGKTYVGTVATITDSTHFTVTPNIGTTVAGKKMWLSTAQGIGIRIGNSPNAHREYFRKNDIEQMQYGIDQKNGSILCYENSLFSNDINYLIEGNSQACSMVNDNSETSGQHIRMTSGVSKSVQCSNARMDIENTITGDGSSADGIAGGFIENSSGAPLLMFNACTENDIDDTQGQRLFYVPSRGRLRAEGWVASVFLSFAKLGLFETAAQIVVNCNNFDTQNVAASVLGPSTAAKQSRTDMWHDANASLFGSAYTFADLAGINEAAAVGKTFFPVQGGSSAFAPWNPNSAKSSDGHDWMVARVSTFGTDTEQAVNGGRFILNHARLPILTNLAYGGGSIPEMVAYFVSAPWRVAGYGGSTALARAFHSEALKGNGNPGTGVTKGVPFESEGLGDYNYFRGLFFFGVPNAVPVDADLDSINLARPYLDEALGTLNMRVKRSDSSFATTHVGLDADYAGPSHTSATGDAPDYSVARIFRLSFAANVTLASPTSPVGDARIVLELRNTDTAPHTVTLGSAFNAPQLNNPSVPASSTRALTFIYNAARTLWICVGDVTV